MKKTLIIINLVLIVATFMLQYWNVPSDNWAVLVYYLIVLPGVFVALSFIGNVYCVFFYTHEDWLNTTAYTFTTTTSKDVPFGVEFHRMPARTEPEVAEELRSNELSNLGKNFIILCLDFIIIWLLIF